MTVATPTQLMALVDASPAAVAAHDKQAWLALWSACHVLEDPLGSRPVLGGLYDRRSGQRGDGPLARFWDTFIAANRIEFTVHADFVASDRVLRDVTITTTLPNGVAADTPAFLLYEVCGEAGQLRIRRMAAHWEVWPVFAQLIRPSRRHVAAMLGVSGRMLHHLGPAASLSFAGAVRSVGQRGKDELRRLVALAAEGEAAAISVLGGHVPGELGKVIAAGDVVCVRCSIDGEPAVLIATLHRRTRAICAVELFATRYTAP